MKAYVVPKKFEKALENLAKLSDKPVDYHLNKALSEYVEDEYDVIKADSIMQTDTSKKVYSFEEVKKELGL